MRRIHPLLFILLVIVGIKVSEQVYRFFAFGDERQRVAVLRRELVDAGAAIVHTREESDSMRAVIRAEDVELEREQKALRGYNRHARDGALPPALYARYKTDLTRYNDHVTTRNLRLADWQEILARNHVAVDRYNALADSLSRLAARMGEPYYPVPTPVEAAVERGLIKPEQ